MKYQLETSLIGELTYFLGLQVRKMEDIIFISQSKYAKSIVKKYGLKSASYNRTPVATYVKITKDEKGVYVDQSLYRNMIGSLIYLTTNRPDITFSVGVCVRHQAKLKLVISLK